MRNFSDINLVTPKDEKINEFVTQSGLPREVVANLYENFAFQYGNDDNVIASKFNDFLQVDIADEQKLINEINNILISDIDNKPAEIMKLISGTNLTCFDLMNVTQYLLTIADKNNPNKLKNIPSALNESYANIINPDLPNGESLLETDFYMGLKTMLSRNNKRWGYNYHLDNVYNSIQAFLAKEIEELTNQNNVVSIDNTAKEQLLRRLIVDKIEPMYRNVDVIKTVVGDIQGLIFDLMVLTTTYVRTQSKIAHYINQDKYDEFRNASNNLYSAIISSRSKSVLMRPLSDEDKPEEFDVPSGIRNNPKDLDFFGIYIDYEKYDLYLTPLKFRNILDAVYMLKSCSSEVNLKVRPVIRNYVTKAFTILNSMEGIIHESKKINKYKN